VTAVNRKTGGNVNKNSIVALCLGIAVVASGAVAAPASAGWFKESPKVTKAEFLKGVDKSITGKRIIGNPAKFIGKKVRLKGQVINVPEEGQFNFMPVGADEAGWPIHVDGDTSKIEAEQWIWVIGTIEDPVEVENALGGTVKLPAITAEFIEKGK
jgi:hypothetical protein